MLTATRARYFPAQLRSQSRPSTALRPLTRLPHPPQHSHGNRRCQTWMMTKASCMEDRVCLGPAQTLPLRQMRLCSTMEGLWATAKNRLRPRQWTATTSTHHQLAFTLAHHLAASLACHSGRVPSVADRPRPVAHQALTGQEVQCEGHQAEHQLHRAATGLTDLQECGGWTRATRWATASAVAQFRPDPLRPQSARTTTLHPTDVSRHRSRLVPLMRWHLYVRHLQAASPRAHTTCTTALPHDKIKCRRCKGCLPRHVPAALQ